MEILQLSISTSKLQLLLFAVPRNDLLIRESLCLHGTIYTTKYTKLHIAVCQFVLLFWP